jgi:hypothetical protein
VNEGQQQATAFLPLARVLLGTVLGGAFGFLVIVWNSGDLASGSFLKSADGFSWLAVVTAQTALWGLILVLTLKKTVSLLQDALLSHPRPKAIGSLAIYSASYVLLLWFPQQLIKNVANDEASTSFERAIPLAHYPVKNVILSAVQLVVVLLPVAGMWLVDWKIRNTVISHRTEEQCFSTPLEARSYLLSIGAALTTLVAFSFLGLVLWGKALRPYVGFEWFTRPPLVIYGVYLTVLVALPYVPACLNLLRAGRHVRDRLYPSLFPSSPEFEERDAVRKKVDEMLGLPMGIKESLKIVTTILVPVITSLLYAFLGLKQ